MSKLKILLILFLTMVFSIFLFIYFSNNNTAKTHDVVLTTNGFEPAFLAIRRGDSIKFTTTLSKSFWPASDPHPLHTGFSVFDPKKPINPEASWEFKFSKVGEWPYHDHLFPAYKGRVIVLSKHDFEIRNKVLTRDDVIKFINKNGPDGAYQLLKKVYDSTTAVAHTTFHLFGEVLYTKYGLNGISYCDDFGGFGCYHGLFIKAVGDKGLAVATELDQKCIEKFGTQGLGCPHGIGHGLVEYFGLGKVSEALALCTKLTWQGAFFGCSGGVFMENNFPTIFDKEGVGKVTARDAHGNLFEPCLSVPSNFKQSCYFEQASWWSHVFANDYSKVGKFCGQLRVQTEKEACFLGVGNSVTEVNRYSADRVLAACGQMPDSNSEAVCRAGASWAFFSNPDQRQLSESVCSGLGAYENLCLEKRMLIK